MNEWDITSQVLKDGPEVYFKRLKKALGLTYKEITHQTNITYNTLKRFETTGHKDNIRIWALERYINFCCERLNTKIDWTKVYAFIELYNESKTVWLADKPFEIRYILYLINYIYFSKIDNLKAINEVIRILNTLHTRAGEEGSYALFYDPDYERKNNV